MSKPDFIPRGTRVLVSNDPYKPPKDDARIGIIVRCDMWPQHTYDLKFEDGDGECYSWPAEGVRRLETP